jgi:hypothetical protein
MIELTLISGGEQLTCGSELARDGGLSGNAGVDYAIVIASKLAPTGFRCSKR